MADLNALAQPHIRQPRAAVKLNGSIVTGWASWSVDNNNMRSADTFEVTFVISKLTAGFGVDWFASQTAITVEVFATEDWTGTGPYAPTAADRLILGDVDDIQPIDFDQGTIELTGRDFTARLIDTKTAENHQNATSSDVAKLLAGRHGLTVVGPATSTRVGQFYAIDHTDINQQQSEWDLLSRLADFEGFDVFVRGTELHFEPKPADTGKRYVVTYRPASDDEVVPLGSTSTLNFSRSLTIAKGVAVEVRSWNSKQKKAFTSYWPKAVKGARPGKATSSDPSGTLVYHFHVPGLTPDQAVDRAKKLYAQIVQHMVKLHADMPGDNLLTCNTIVAVRGTGTALDQDFFPDSVRRSMSFQEGYRMSLSAKNVSADVEAAAA